MRIYCSDCGKPVTNELPGEVVFRGTAQCPECTQKEPECICTTENAIPVDTGHGQISKDELKEFLEILDEKAAESEDEEVPPEYYEGIFTTTNDIRRKFGIPLAGH